MLKAIMFDLDGTLLPMDTDLFTKLYIGGLAEKLAPYGLDPKKVALSLMEGVKAMVKNDGSTSNADCFWNVFKTIVQVDPEPYTPYFDEFYEKYFVMAKKACGFNPLSGEIISTLKKKGYRLILATNPLFPATATFQRAQWAGLNPDDFEWISSFENSSYCKPNPKYYEEILNRFDLKTDEVIMVGNDVQEDLAAMKLGIKVCLINDELLNRKGEPFEAEFLGSMAEFKDYIEKKL